MAAPYGWAGKLLFVDLTRGTTRWVDTMAYADDFIGGRGLGAALAWELLTPGMDPFDPECPLMFLNGPLAGTPAPSAGRTTVCSLTPQGYPTPWFSRSSIGGDLGHHLKYAGYDGIVFTGQAPSPVYVLVEDGSVRIESADDIWGQGIMATQQLIHQRHGARCQVATIGQAGENLSRIATIGTNLGSAAGQGGFGAVMGSKQLKALVVHGTGRPTLADPEGFRQFTRAVAQEYLRDVRNRSGAPQQSTGNYGQRRNRCSTGCLAGCGSYFEGVPGTLCPEQEYSGIVQCTAGRFRGAEGHYWSLGFEAGFELNMMANDWGINHWDLLKGLFPWIGMCHRDGLLDEIGGRQIELDRPEFWRDVLDAIATHDGALAEIVGDGGRRAITRTGLLPETARQLYTGQGYANHWDGRGPRGNYIVYPFWLASALLWMVDSRDPMGNTHGYVQEVMRVSPFGQSILTWEQLAEIGEHVYGRREAMDPLSDYEGKAEPALWHAQRSVIKDSMPLCDRVFPRLFSSLSDDGLPSVDGVEGPAYEARFLELATGRPTDAENLQQAAERVLTLERSEQVRDYGRSRSSDNGVIGYFCDTDEERPNPLLAGKKSAERDPLMALADEFYELHGWDAQTGIPHAEHLRELGLDGAIDQLEALDGGRNPRACRPQPL